jgi:hypothetical protein
MFLTRAWLAKFSLYIFVFLITVGIAMLIALALVGR